MRENLKLILGIALWIVVFVVLYNKTISGLIPNHSWRYPLVYFFIAFTMTMIGVFLGGAGSGVAKTTVLIFLANFVVVAIIAGLVHELHIQLADSQSIATQKILITSLIASEIGVIVGQYSHKPTKK